VPFADGAAVGWSDSTKRPREAATLTPGWLASCPEVSRSGFPFDGSTGLFREAAESAAVCEMMFTMDTALGARSKARAVAQ
jgi:hypothetical protein